jgi:hypothetical protein
VRERVELPDGDFVDVDWLGPAGAPTVVVLHGLEGSIESPYAASLLRSLGRAGLRGALLHFRGCSGEPNRRLRQYHSGETGDLACVVGRVAGEVPGRPVLLAGFSLGGNQIVKWLGERGEALPPEVRAAAAVSVPFDLAACARALDGAGFWPWVYRERFLRRLRRKARAKAALHPGAFDLDAVLRSRTFAEYDDLVTAPIHGFAGAGDYWRRSGAAAFLPGVRRPLLLISAADDPLVPATALPVEAARANPSVTLEVTSAGGHVGFVGGAPWRREFWAEGRVLDFLASRAGAG